MATMNQIAELAGVSRSTVSLVLNDKPLAQRIPAKTKNKIHEAAEKLGYRPNEIAQSLITGKTRELAFVTTQMNRQFVVHMLWGAMEAVDKKGYYLKLLPISSKESNSSIMENLLKRNIDGVILQGLDADSTEWFQMQLIDHKIPCCLLGSSLPAKNGIRVVSDDVQGAGNGIKYLFQHGHRNIIFLNGRSDWPAFKIRKEAAVDTARELDIRLTAIDFEQYHPANPVGEQVNKNRDSLMEVLKDQINDNTAIFCANDILGVLSIQACHNLGISIPGDLSIMGYSISILSRFCQPDLTVVTQPHHDMGHEAASGLVDVLMQDDSRIFERALEINLPTGIHEGGTVARI